MIRAIHFDDFDAFREKRLPGSISISDRDEDGEVFVWYCCPCGCGSVAPLLAGVKFKPASQRPSWNWNGSKTEATLHPSVNHVGHWHGWLRDGYWEAC